MKEIFKPAPDEPADPGRVYYTLTADDVGKRVIVTTIGAIHVGDIMGAVLPIDVGKRLYRVPGGSGLWLWQAENDDQRDARLGQEVPAHGSLFMVSTSTGRTFRYHAVSAEQAEAMFNADRQEMDEASQAKCGQFVSVRLGTRAALSRQERAMIPPRGCGVHHAGECSEEWPHNARE
jgi:hypothetical protein